MVVAGDAHLPHTKAIVPAGDNNKQKHNVLLFGSALPNKKRNVSLEIKSTQSCQHCTFTRGEIFFFSIQSEQQMANSVNQQHLTFHIKQWFCHLLGQTSISEIIVPTFSSPKKPFTPTYLYTPHLNLKE